MKSACGEVEFVVAMIVVGVWEDALHALIVFWLPRHVQLTL